MILRGLVLAVLAAVVAPSATGQDAVVESPLGYRLAVPAGWERGVDRDLLVFRAAGEREGFPTLSIQHVLDSPAARLDRDFEAYVEQVKASLGVEFETAGSIDLGGRPARSIRFRGGEAGRFVWQVFASLEGDAALVLTFGCDLDVLEERLEVFERVVAGLVRTAPPVPAAGYRLERHPVGLALEVPEGWTARRSGPRVLFFPPGDRRERAPLVLAVTAPAPEALDTLEEVEAEVVRSVQAAGADLDLASESGLGGVPARHVAWTDPARREVTSQYVAIWHGALVALTLTAPVSDLDDLEPILEHAASTLRLP